MSGEVNVVPADALDIVRVPLCPAGKRNAIGECVAGIAWDLRGPRLKPACAASSSRGRGRSGRLQGGGIFEYPGFRLDPAALCDFHEGAVWRGLSAMLHCDVPIVAAIAEAGMGAGVEIAACAD